MPAEMAFCQKVPKRPALQLLLITNWLDLGHVGTTSCKGVWKIAYLCFPVSIIEEHKGEGSVYSQSTVSAMSDRPKMQA